jgi:hypothetical protein
MLALKLGPLGPADVHTAIRSVCTVDSLMELRGWCSQTIDVAQIPGNLSGISLPHRKFSVKLSVIRAYL